MGGREDFVLVGRPEPQEDEQGLRAALPESSEAFIYICGDDTAYGEAADPLVRLFRQFLSSW
jgi:hypothetical protein